MAIWILLTISILLILVIIFAVSHRYVKNYIDTHYKMGIYADMEMSLKNQTIYLNLVNANRNKDFWNAHEDMLRLYASGTEINSVFYKTPSVPTGFKIVYSTTMSNIEILSMITAVKYNTLEVSFDGGVTRVHVKSIHDKIAEKISKKMEAHADAENADKQRRHILDEIAKTGKSRNLAEFEETRIISHVNEGRTTGTSMRFQAIIPPDHPITKGIFNPHDGSAGIYFIYEGHCYKMNCQYIGQIENLYEWDIVDLKPGTIYAGLTFSVDGGKTLYPSSALYGITKDKHGELPTIDEAHLAKPEEGSQPYEMWTEATAVAYMGESLTHKTYSILVKKHYEDEYSEEYLALTKTHEYYDDYEWLNLEKNKRRNHLGHGVK